MSSARPRACDTSPRRNARTPPGRLSSHMRRRVPGAARPASVVRALRMISPVTAPARNLIAELRETGRLARLAAWRAVVEMYEGDDLTFAASIGYYALLS